jgi:RNA polymerase I-specific transcription initiation factor RRN3
MLSVASAPSALAGCMMATPLKSALKRKHSDISSAEDDSQHSQKRAKVQFSDADNKTEIIRAWNDKPTNLVREEVRRAIERHHAGDSGLYDTLKQTFTAKPSSEDAPPPTLLEKYMSAFTRCITILGKDCAELVEAVLDTQWLGRDEEFVRCYQKMLAHLAASGGGYAHAVLESLVDKFVNCKHLPRC